MLGMPPPHVVTQKRIPRLTSSTLLWEIVRPWLLAPMKIPEACPVPFTLLNMIWELVESEMAVNVALSSDVLSVIWTPLTMPNIEMSAASAVGIDGTSVLKNQLLVIAASL